MKVFLGFDVVVLIKIGKLSRTLDQLDLQCPSNPVFRHSVRNKVRLSPLHLESNELIDECSYSFRVALPSIAQSSRYINGEIIGMNIVTTTGYALLI